MEAVKIWEECVIIPTYEVGEEEKNPMFLEKRVYQGSSGKVYPYPTIESISTEKKDKKYQAVILENEYLKIMVLPELGGRIQRAYDKTNHYDFVYYNHVIKPALVGLLGPWISGGIEFNWPQHHRPTTFKPVDYELVRNQDGSASILLNDVDQINGTKGILKVTLYPGKSYIEIGGQLYNRTSLPQTFLWWANPAVPVNENTQSIFPPDVHAVMDHGKRDVSRFPIATGVYYKKDYSEGVDISRYKNIPVPTSYMAEKSNYDFVGGYDYGREAGILHVADHHISPGKKQWTWGCGDFGKAWDRNLTDEDGPYVELMTGVYTDNQPDFTWLKPFEEKTFTQYFMPYKKVGKVSNATKEAVLKAEINQNELELVVYATGVYENAVIKVVYDGEKQLEESAILSPEDIYERKIQLHVSDKEKLEVSVWNEGKCLVSYRPEKQEIEAIPDPAKEAKKPSEIMTNEELYLTGLHIEQYRHATYLPDSYYLEGLKRDSGDIRINNAYGILLMRRGNFEEAEKYFRKALERLTERNPNPYNSEVYYNLGLVLFFQQKRKAAFDQFYKATWSNEQQEMSFYYMAAIQAMEHNYENALDFVEKSLIKNSHNIKARGLKVYILRKLGHLEEAKKQAAKNLVIDPFDFISANEEICMELETLDKSKELQRKMRGFEQNYLMCARDYAEMGAYKEAIQILQTCKKTYPMLKYYEAYYLEQLGEDGKQVLAEAEECDPDYCFPNKLEDIAVLEYAITNGARRRASYYLGNLYYDKLQFEKAQQLWEMSVREDDSFPTVHRNLSLAYYNKCQNPEAAKRELEKAFALNTSDARVLLELDQLYKKLGMSNEERRCHLEQHIEIVNKRDDLYIEYLTLLNLCGKQDNVYELIMAHNFHPWEGGEGKVSAQYTLALLKKARIAMERNEWEKAEGFLRASLEYPENFGEGKLEGTKDNHIYYHLGEVLEHLGRKEEANICFEKATKGTNEPANVMYYNDQPADMILYQGLAFLKLGNKAAANTCFYRLLDFGERHLNDKVEIEYFAVSLPDFLIFEEDYTRKNYIHCCYLMGLANIGMRNFMKAESFLKEVLTLEPSHMMGGLYKQELEKVLMPKVY